MVGKAYRRQQRECKKDYSQKLIVPLDDFDWSFTMQEVEQIQDFHEQGLKPTVIAQRIEREPEEVFVMLLDLAYHKRIKLVKGLKL